MSFMRKNLNYLDCFNTFLVSLLWICLSNQTFSQENENKSQDLPRSSPVSQNVDGVILEDFIRPLDSKFKGIHSGFPNVGFDNKMNFDLTGKRNK